LAKDHESAQLKPKNTAGSAGISQTVYNELRILNSSSTHEFVGLKHLRASSILQQENEKEEVGTSESHLHTSAVGK